MARRKLKRGPKKKKPCDKYVCKLASGERKIRPSLYIDCAIWDRLRHFCPPDTGPQTYAVQIITKFVEYMELGRNGVNEEYRKILEKYGMEKYYRHSAKRKVTLRLKEEERQKAEAKQMGITWEEYQEKKRIPVVQTY